ncbi:uncharacterized protein MKZ38_000432 [Zalerion maritima]|uniref:Rhodopsin domain-containing protein n=1 Tax=Zalerion maritima TaxID=339359 RepID=A0AAD5RY77_9PEZI|nr:uncharacterized protein MKZ38_000432 [Zalerion maritima]
MASHDRRPELTAVTVLFLALTTISTFLRCYVRLRLLRIFKTEDSLAVFTFLCYILFSATVLLSVKYGAGMRVEEVPDDYIALSMKWRWAGEVVWVITSVLLKYTVGIFLLPICTRKWQSRVIWITLTIVTVYHAFYIFIVIFQCRPISWYWYRYTSKGKGGLLDDGECWSPSFSSRPTYASATINAAADWTLGLLPIALVWNLSMNRRMKLSLGLVLGLGSIASAATIVRFPYVHLLRDSHDPLYVFTDLAIWSTIENGLGLTASSLATLRPLFKKLFAKDLLTRPPLPRAQRQSRTTAAINNNHVQLASRLRSGLFCRGSVQPGGHGAGGIDLESARGLGAREGVEGSSVTTFKKKGALSSGTELTWEPPLSPRDVGVAVTRDRFIGDGPYDSDILGEWRPNGYPRRSSPRGSSLYSR